MRYLRFIVRGQELTKAPDCDFSNIIAGTSGYLVAAFEFDGEWDGTTKAAAFYKYRSTQENGQLIKDNECLIPDDVLNDEVFKIGVVGVKGKQRITTNLVTIRQEKGSGQSWQQ